MVLQISSSNPRNNYACVWPAGCGDGLIGSWCFPPSLCYSSWINVRRGASHQLIISSWYLYPSPANTDNCSSPDVMSSDAGGMFTVMRNTPGSLSHIICHQSWEDIMRLRSFKSSVRTAVSQRCGWQIELCSQFGSSLGLGSDCKHTSSVPTVSYTFRRLFWTWFKCLTIQVISFNREDNKCIYLSSMYFMTVKAKLSFCLDSWHLSLASECPKLSDLHLKPKVTDHSFCRHV